VEGGSYSTARVAEALFSSYAAERTKLVRAQLEEQEMRNSQMRGSLIDRDDLLHGLSDLFVGVKSIILASNLDARAKDDLSSEIAGYPGLVRQAETHSKERLGIKPTKPPSHNEQAGETPKKSGKRKIMR
jgi:hypothetical protein